MLGAPPEGRRPYPARPGRAPIGSLTLPGCNVRNDSSRFLRIVLDSDEIKSASVETAYLDRRPIDAQEGYRWLDSPPRAISARAHRPAYGSDGDYWSKPNREDVFRAVYDLMHDADPTRYPSIY